MKNPLLHVNRLPIQSKLSIGKPNDKYEQEADLMADKVMAMPKSQPRVQRKCEECEEEQLQMKPLAESVTPILQKQPVEEEEEMLQMQPMEEEEELLQPKSTDTPSSASPDLQSQLSASKGKGNALPESTNRFMSSAFGSDFSHVRVHTGARAAEMTQSINAKAFTHGNDIYFNKGEFHPENNGGKHLLAHELTHVIQQGGQKNIIHRKKPKKNRKNKQPAAPKPYDPKLAAQQKMWEDLKAFYPGTEAGRKLAGSGYEDSTSDLRADFTEGKKGGTSTSAPIMNVGKDYTGLSDKKRKAALDREMLKVDRFRVEKGRIDDLDIPDPQVNTLIDKQDEAGLQTLVANMQGLSKFIANTKMIAHVNAKIVVLQKIAQAKKDLVTTFKLKSVVDGNKKWTLPELTILKDALNMVPAGDKPALEGVKIERVISLGGTTAGEFSWKVSKLPQGGTSFTHFRKMELADLAFPAGNSAEAKRIIIHEVGHGVASLKQQQAQIAANEAIIKQNVTDTKADDTFDEWKTARDEAKAALDLYKAKKKEHDSEKDPARKAELKKEMDTLLADFKAKKAVDATKLKANQAAVAANKSATATATSKKAKAKALDISASQLAAIKSANDRAKSTHDTRLTAAGKAISAMTVNDSDVSDYITAVNDVSAKVVSFFNDTIAQDKSSDEVKALIKTVDSSMSTRNSAKAKLVAAKKGNNVISTLASLESAQSVLYNASKKHSLAKKRNKKTHEFAKFVEANRIDPLTISQYAADNWPHKPEELYAECYSFFVTGQLAAKSRVLNTWFKSGKYK